MSIKLIVALDFDNLPAALRLVDALDPAHCAVKIGNEMFTLFGPTVVQTLVAQQFKVFLDLKFHDIPNTVARSCRAAADLGVWMMNVHAIGGLSMMQAAREALMSYGAARPLLIAVTVLTSMGHHELLTLGIQETLEVHVRKLACLAKEAALDGVVSSAHEAPLIKEACGSNFVTVTPGIRLTTAKTDDQTRIITPADALKAGSDYLVVGRPITQAEKPAQVVQQLLAEIRYPAN
ncbi:orotidine-5'-phosphate decarboxylase [Legionella oakridgensis]|uniref:Orotidine 5'-phosphate decarboxylase n=2 Tax=Legionella oakridgensis TaxID=29423 RepID=W0BBX5_9GAMM|nr:orotidine-5'-phosphate decarboxylase [Legionella oakridgensis]AHE67335.1 orotidine 5''-phosphate decarboxylase, subfamily 1 [Legionella oakridgensis ATCC 33761 = DSM 21215]ETO93085.1 orotidine-5''-phosphate decarboxylase [Legionella oakridgensis RV-2-2007]KTD37879.1 orotidine 5'-phosphate decarboxylase [Legionella oakridgensis]STY20399.1 orotidine-5'-phosphate decarboxylase [Legionella longbeachae]